MNITVYLRAPSGRDGKYMDITRELGHWIGSHGHDLIYGGSRVGLMGVLADAVLETGGKVIGVEPFFFVEDELQHDDITELIITSDMPQRKAKMIEMGAAYIAIPGGTGTLEEISEVISLTKLGMNSKPCIILNIDGYYDELKKLLDKMVEEEFLEIEARKQILFISGINELNDVL